MKKILVLFMLFMSVTLYAEINLDKNIWWVHKGFEKSLIYSKVIPTVEGGWKSVTGKVVKMADLYPNATTKDWQYTITTRFDAPDDMLRFYNAVGLYIPGIGEAWQIYINGKLIADQFAVSDNGKIIVNRAVRNGIIDFTPNILRKHDNVLLFRIAGNPKFWRTGLYQFPGFTIDRLSTLNRKHSELVVFMLMTFYLIIGLFYIVMYFTRSKERYVVYLGMFTFGLFIYFFTRSDYVFQIFSRSDVILRVEYGSLFFLFPAFYGFLDTLYFKNISFFVKGLYVLSGVLIVLAIFTPFYYTRYVLYIWQITAMFSIVYFVYLNYRAVRSKVEEVKFLLPGTLIVVFTTISL